MENKEYKAIATGLYGGTSAFYKGKPPYELEVVSCCNSENCPLFKQKKCIMADRMSRMNWWSQDAKCPYSQIKRFLQRRKATKRTASTTSTIAALHMQFPYPTQQSFSMLLKTAMT